MISNNKLTEYELLTIESQRNTNILLTMLVAITAKEEGSVSLAKHVEEISDVIVRTNNNIDKLLNRERQND